MLVVLHGGSAMYEPDVSGGVIELSVIGENGKLVFLLVSAVLSIFCSVCARSLSRLITLSMRLSIRFTSFRYSSFLLTVSCAYLAMLSLWFWLAYPASSSAMALPLLSYLEILPLSASCCVWCPGIHFHVYGFHTFCYDGFLRRLDC